MSDSKKYQNVESDSTTIYAGGSIFEISVDDLEKNPTAIKQLINSHNLQGQEIKKLTNELQSKAKLVEYLKTSPFTAIISAIINVIGAIIVAIGVNGLSSTNNSNGWSLIVIGGILIITASLANILYPYARNWFNRGIKKEINNA